MSERLRWHVRLLDWVAVKFFKANDEGRAELRLLATRPRAWLKGEGVTDDKRMLPWEKLLFALHGFLVTSSAGFSSDEQRNRLWLFTYRVNPHHLTISGLIVSVVDFFNDIFIGQLMDSRTLLDPTYRNIVRGHHVVNSVVRGFLMAYLGLSSQHRVIMFTVIRCVMDALGTAGGISYQKYYAGISPLSSERSRAGVWQNVGAQMGWPIGNLPAWIMGFARDRQVWTDHRVITRGFWIAFPLLLASNIVNTLARNRVQIEATPKAKRESLEGLSLGEKIRAIKQRMIKMIEPYKVLRYNRYLIVSTIAGLFQIFIPSVPEYPIYRRLVPPVTVFGREIRGEGIMPIRTQIAGTPVTFLHPFVGRIVDRLGGPKRTQIVAHVCYIGLFLTKYLVGFESPGAIAAVIAADTLNHTVDPLHGHTEHILLYEMFDYVEWKTGVRSEGVTTAFNGLRQKLIKDNIGRAVTNTFQAWTGITDGDIGDPNFETPERFVRWAWPVFTLGPLVSNVIALIRLFFFPYDPAEMLVMEAELKQRRELAQQAKEQVQEENMVH